jgi:VanZ family protein
VWAGAIWVFSTDVFSAASTSRWLYPTLHWLMPGAGPSAIYAAAEAVRKLAHLFEYFVLAIFVVRGFRGPERGWRFSWGLATVALIGCYAALDEVHQAFVPSRRSSAFDVLLDVAGAIAAQVVLWLASRRSRRPPEATTHAAQPAD